MYKTLSPTPLHHFVFGNGPNTLLLLCGFQAELNCWRSVQSLLSSMFVSIAIENRGFGKIMIDHRPVTIEGMAEDILQLVNDLNLDRFYLAGHSMGGAIAQVIAHRTPERVKGLALCNTFRAISTESRDFLGEMLHALERGQDPIEVRHQMLMRTFAVSALRAMSTQAIARQQVQRKVATTESFRRQFEALCDFDSRGWIDCISVPTMVVYSEGDRVAGEMEAISISKSIRNSELLKLPGSHASMIEYPDLLGKALVNFFEKSQK